MANDPQQGDTQSDDWELYLQVFLDESDEHLESLMQALLKLENDPSDTEALNEAFRLLHTHKGSAGLMGFEGISELAHQLENRFDQFRSGSVVLDRPRITAMLGCVDFLQQFNASLRAGSERNEDTSAVLRQLEAVEQEASDDPPVATEQPGAALPSLHGGYRLHVEFEPGLQLADMKARLIVARLSNIGEVIGTDPPVEDTQSFEDLAHFALIVLTDQGPGAVESVAGVDGVRSVRIEGGPTAEQGTAEPSAPTAAPSSRVSVAEAERPPETEAPPIPEQPPARDTPAPQVTESAAAPTAEPGSAVAETVRVGIDRLDKLMNLTGELVVTRERIAQITGELSSSGRTSQTMDDLGERLRAGLAELDRMATAASAKREGWREVIAGLREDAAEFAAQRDAWEADRRRFSRITETVDRLNRVTSGLQQSVLDTRMVPVGPLFNRFRRVIRDLAGERNKQVRLVIEGERTELDKRMIDELGDPLLHLVRNSLDHGIEAPEKREQAGKPEVGTISLEAAHRGNNVFITIRDDGGGLNIDRVRERLVARGIASEASVAAMSEQQIIDHIWAPGFSTATEVTEISGRGVGMDVVKQRIAELNGSIEVESQPGVGTSFRLRLPLTLAIIRSLLVRFRSGCFSMPIDDVREIVSIRNDQVHSVHGRETIEIRGEFIPLVRMDRTFQWPADVRSSPTMGEPAAGADNVSVVVLYVDGRAVGLCVDELLGSGDIVIKSLSDNFVNIQGLSGASIMGSGDVCLMLDSAEMVKLAASSVGRSPSAPALGGREDGR